MLLFCLIRGVGHRAFFRKHRAAPTISRRGHLQNAGGFVRRFGPVSTVRVRVFGFNFAAIFARGGLCSAGSTLTTMGQMSPAEVDFAVRSAARGGRTFRLSGGIGHLRDDDKTG